MVTSVWILAGLLAASGAASPMEEGLRLMSDDRPVEALPHLERALREEPGSPQVLRNLGWAYWHAGRLDSAHATWSLLLDLDPRNAVTLRLLAALEVDRGEPARGAELAGKALALDPADGEATAVLAKARLRLGDRAQALSLLDGLAARRSLSHSVRFHLADLLAELGRLAPASEILDGLVRAHPGVAKYRRRRAEVLYARGDAQAAIKEWRRLAGAQRPDAQALAALGWAYWKQGKADLAWRHWVRLARLSPGDPRPLTLLADVLLERNQPAEALALSRRAKGLAPGSPAARLTEARALMGLQQHQEAIDALEELARSQTEDPAVRFQLAEALAAAGRKREAIEVLDGLVRAQPLPAYRRRRAQVLYEGGRAADAMAEWRALAESESPDMESLMQLGWAHLERNELDEAHRIWSLLASLDPRNPVFLRFLAETEISRGAPEKGAALARKAVEAAPDDADAALLLARTLETLSEVPEALRVLQRLVARRPEEPRALLNLAALLTRAGKPQEALIWWEKLAAADPSQPRHRRGRAEALYELERYDEATAAWTELAKAEPPDEPSVRLLVQDARARKDHKALLRWLGALSAIRAPSADEWLWTAEGLAAQDKTAPALEAVEEAIALSSGSIEAYHLKADILESAGRWAKAYAAHGEALRRNPHCEISLRARYRLAGDDGKHRKALRGVRNLQRLYASRAAAPELAVKEAWYLSESGKPEAAMRVLAELTRERLPVLPALVYHGISRQERGDGMPAANFWGQMHALRLAGYHAVTIADLDRFFKGEPLPARSVLITFDDGRRDAFERADPVLEATGMRAVMFTHLAGLSRHSFHATLPELKRWRATGRWEIQAHGARAHGSVPVDAGGRQGLFLTSRRWLEGEGRPETLEEFTARVEAEHREAKAAIEAAFPGAAATAYAFPYGDYGQRGDADPRDAALLNQRLVAKRFRYAFAQDPLGFNTPHTPRTRLRRFTVPDDMSGVELVRHLRMNDPWVQAKLLEAKLRVIWGQPALALKGYESIEAEGIVDAELLEQKAAVLSALGQPERAAEALAQGRRLALAERRPARRPRYAPMESKPVVGGGVDAFADGDRRRSSRALARAALPMGGSRLGVWFGRGSYTEPGAPGLKSQEAGLDARGAFGGIWSYGAFFSRRAFSGARTGDADGFGGELSAQVLPTFRAQVSYETGPVDSALALAAGRSYRGAGARVDWDALIHTSVFASLGRSSYNDGNEQADFRAGATRRLGDWLSAGYEFWYGDSERKAADYWSPRALRRHMGVLTASNPVGPLRASVSAGLGYGVEESGSRPVQTLASGLSWRLHEAVLLSVQGKLQSTPSYRSRTLSGGLSVGF